jgi:hypothetical protein
LEFKADGESIQWVCHFWRHQFKSRIKGDVRCEFSWIVKEIQQCSATFPRVQETELKRAEIEKNWNNRLKLIFVLDEAGEFRPRGDELDYPSRFHILRKSLPSGLAFVTDTLSQISHLFAISQQFQIISTEG